MSFFCKIVATNVVSRSQLYVRTKVKYKSRLFAVKDVFSTTTKKTFFVKKIDFQS